MNIDNQNQINIYHNYLKIFRKFNSNHNLVFLEFSIKDEPYFNIVKAKCTAYINFDNSENPYDCKTFTLFFEDNMDYNTFERIIYEKIGEYICQPKN